MRRKLGLHVSDRCRERGPKGWSEFRLFVKQYWRLLLTYTLLVSESTAAILYEVGLEIEKIYGEKPLWDVEISDNRRVLVGKLAVTGPEKMERLLLFFDPKSMPQEMESLWVLRLAASERGQKLHINFYGAHQWAEREARLLNNLENRPVIGANDAIVFVGQKPGLMLDRFATEYLDKVVLFPRFILPPHARKTMNGYLRKIDPRYVLSEKKWITTEDITQLLLNNYRQTQANLANSALCHVIACPGFHMEEAMQALIQECADPHMRVHLMLDPYTAEEWIQQPFECQEPSGMVQ